jgi:hypothetical protein
MKTRQRKLTGRERELLAHVRRAQARQMPLVRYCRAKGLAVQTIYNLRSRLAGEVGGDGRESTERHDPAAAFIAVRLAPTEAAPAVAACRLQKKGWVIECASLPPAAWLAVLMDGDADAVP